MTQIVECIPNFSEGRRPAVIEAIAAAAAAVESVKVIGRELDADHHRAVVTLAGPLESVEEAAFAALAQAIATIDLREHRGEHPRMGAMDVCPFVPVANATMDQCVAAAHRLGRRAGAQLGLPIFLYEAAATRPERRNLAFIRRGGFERLAKAIGKDPEWDPDFGPRRIHPSAGATAIGARFFLIAFNINLATDDVALARRISRAIRERDGGLDAVKALGMRLHERGLAQVSMNLTNYRVTPILRVFEEVERLAAQAGVDVLESELIGLAPEEALTPEIAQRVRLRDFCPDRQILEKVI